jgi:hypothetical protein
MKTIQINNNHYQECDIVMSKSGKNNSKIGLNLNAVTGKHLYFFEQGAKFDETQHLSILSNEEIKDSDWVIRGDGELDQMTPNKMIDYLDSQSLATKKIIATTDTSLSIKKEQSGENIWTQQLPQIPHSFIEQFISEYNKGNVISKVLIEVEHNKLYPMVQNNNFKIKLNQNNEITIKTI